jgi:hypothetical protein
VSLYCANIWVQHLTLKMPYHPIEDDKACVGFAAGTSGIYKTWRDAVKLQMTSLEISGKADAGREKWAELTEWALSKKPLRSRAALHGTKSAAGKSFTAAVDRLLVDVSKKLAHTRRRREDLDGSPEAVGAQPPKSGKFKFNVNPIIN